MDDELEISLEDLGRTYQQFAAQNSERPQSHSSKSAAAEPIEPLWSDEDDATLGSDVPTTPEGILEAVLFLGHPKNREISANSLASLMRGVEADEIRDIVERLNQRYIQNRSGLRVLESESGYRMGLIGELNEIKSVFAGKVQTVKLNQQAIDCLAIIAYTPGITQEEIDQRWSRSANSVVRMLIRRNLVEVKIEGSGKNTLRRFYTTDRFLNLIGLEVLEDLPIAWE